MDKVRKKEITKALERCAGSVYVTPQQIKEFLGYKDHHMVREIVYGLRSLGTRYYSGDVVERICEMEKWKS